MYKLKCNFDTFYNGVTKKKKILKLNTNNTFIIYI